MQHLLHLVDCLFVWPVKQYQVLHQAWFEIRLIPSADSDGDEPQTTYVTWYGAFEFLVMPFGLTNELVTFCILMNQVFHKYLDKFVVVYLHNILVYSATMELHKKNLSKVF